METETSKTPRKGISLNKARKIAEYLLASEKTAKGDLSAMRELREKWAVEEETKKVTAEVLVLLRKFLNRE